MKFVLFLLFNSVFFLNLLLSQKDSSLRYPDTLFTISSSAWDSIRTKSIKLYGDMPLPITFSDYFEVEYIVEGLDTVDGIIVNVQHNSLFGMDGKYEFIIKEHYKNYTYIDSAVFMNYSKSPLGTYEFFSSKNTKIERFRKYSRNSAMDIWVDTSNKHVLFTSELGPNMEFLDFIYPFYAYLRRLENLNDYAIVDIQDNGYTKRITYLMTYYRKSETDTDSLRRVFPYTVTWNLKTGQVIMIEQKTKLPTYKGNVTSRFTIFIGYSALTRTEKRHLRRKFFNEKTLKGKRGYKNFQVIEGEYRPVRRNKYFYW